MRESGITTDKDSQLELNTRYTKITKIGSLPLGATTITEYACQSGVVSKSTVQDFWICDKITAIKTGTEDGKKYVIYSFQIHGDEKIYEDNYDGAYFYLNQLQEKFNHMALIIRILLQNIWSYYQYMKNRV